MFKSRPLIRTVIILLAMLNVVLYPIGKTVTNANGLNNLFDAINFEKVFLSIYTSILSNQLSAQLDKSTVDQISKELISEEALKKQRITNVENFLLSIENKQVPSINFEIENPLSKIQKGIKGLGDNIEDLFNNFVSGINCAEDSSNGVCKFLSSITKKDSTDNESAEDITSDLDFSINSTLGINEQNIGKVNLIYRLLKYGPEAILVLITVLAIIGYATTIPDLTFARKLVVALGVSNIWALTLWGGIPYIFKSTNPIKFAFNTTDYAIERSLNQGIGDILSSMSKDGILLSFAFSITALILYIFIALIVHKNKEVNEIITQKKLQENEEDKDDDEQNDETINNNE